MVVQDSWGSEGKWGRHHCANVVEVPSLSQLDSRAEGQKDKTKEKTESSSMTAFIGSAVSWVAKRNRTDCSRRQSPRLSGNFLKSRSKQRRLQISNTYAVAQQGEVVLSKVILAPEKWRPDHLWMGRNGEVREAAPSISLGFGFLEEVQSAFHRQNAQNESQESAERLWSQQVHVARVANHCIRGLPQEE